MVVKHQKVDRKGQLWKKEMVWRSEKSKQSKFIIHQRMHIWFV